MSQPEPHDAPPAGTDDAGSPPQIAIRLNGAERAIPAGTTVSALLALLGIPPVRVAVERNRRVVRRADHAACTLEEGDVIEIVSFVGGG